jgi:hypothetical protein
VPGSGGLWREMQVEARLRWSREGGGRSGERSGRGRKKKTRWGEAASVALWGPAPAKRGASSCPTLPLGLGCGILFPKQI